jgi:hypothetical protein
MRECLQQSLIDAFDTTPTEDIDLDGGRIDQGLDEGRVPRMSYFFW